MFSAAQAKNKYAIVGFPVAFILLHFFGLFLTKAIALYGVNYVLLNCFETFLSHKLQQGLVADALLQMFILLSAKSTISKFSTALPALYASVLITLSMVLFATSFLNFGLSYLMCLLFSPLALYNLGSGSKAKKIVALLVLFFSPISILLMACSFKPSRPYSIQILRNVFAWNSGIPFVLVQPLLVLLVALILWTPQVAKKPFNKTEQQIRYFTQLVCTALHM